MTMSKDRIAAIAAAVIALILAIGVAADWWSQSTADEISEAADDLRDSVTSALDALGDVEDSQDSASAQETPDEPDAENDTQDGDEEGAPQDLPDTENGEGSGVGPIESGAPIAIMLALLFMVSACGGSQKPGEALGPWFSDWQLGASAVVCLDGKVVFGADGIDAEWSAEACAAAELKGIDVAEFCFETGSNDEPPRTHR